MLVLCCSASVWKHKLLVHVTLWPLLAALSNSCLHDYMLIFSCWCIRTIWISLFLFFSKWQYYLVFITSFTFWPRCYALFPQVQYWFPQDWRLSWYTQFASLYDFKCYFLFSYFLFYSTTSYLTFYTLVAALGAIFSATDSVCTLQVCLVLWKYCSVASRTTYGINPNCHCRCLIRMRHLCYTAWFLGKV